MKRILIVIVAALVGLVFSGAVMAADTAATSRAAMKRPMCAVGKALNLTDEQKAQIRDILKAARADAQKATDKAGKMAVWKAAREKIRTTVLTADQQQKLQQMRQRHDAFKALNLTDEQKTRIKDILTTARADVQKAADKDTKKAVMKAAFDKIKTDVFTDTQRQQLQQMKARHPGKAASKPAAVK